VICVDLTAVLQRVSALREARNGEDFVLLSAGVTDALVRVFAADAMSLNDSPSCAKHSTALELWPVQVAENPRGVSGDPYRYRQWCSTVIHTDDLGLCGDDHALVMPLPAPPLIARRLVFWRRRRFGEEDRSAAGLLQPHIANALRHQSRRSAARLLTGRQRELLRLVAAGHDNIAIARQLGLSPGTVRKHLENAFARLDVSTRTAAVAKVCPDATW
jgi:DNA-binding CsgD family transcriptional regulator